MISVPLVDCRDNGGSSGSHDDRIVTKDCDSDVEVARISVMVREMSVTQ